MARFTQSGTGTGTGSQGEPGTNGLDSLFLGTWNSVTEFLAAYQGGPTGLADGDWWAFVKDNADPNKIYVVREDPNSATGWVIDDNEHFVLPAGGVPGTDALWNYTGAYSGGAAYAVGDIATYDGQLWYRVNSNGGNVGDTPSPGIWNLLAAKGADGEDGEDGSPGLVYLGNYVSGNGYVANLAVVKGSDNNLYIATSSGGLGDPVGNTAEWSIFLPKGADGAQGDPGIQGDPGTSDIADFVFTNDSGNSQSIISLPGNKQMQVGPDAELILGGARNKVIVSENERLVLVSTRPPGEEEYENQWVFGSDAILLGPGEDNLLKVNGLYGKDTDPLFLLAPDTVVISGDGGEFLNDPTVADNQIATLGDLPTGATGTFATSDSKLVTVTNGIITTIESLT